MTATRYSAVFVVTVAAMLLAVALFNVTIDPYAIFDMPRVLNLNAKKPQVSDYTAMAKAYRIEAVAPHSVLLGTSRVDIGADPNHVGWRDADKPVFNYGVPTASSLFSLQAQLRHAVSSGPVRHALIGVEFHDFLHAHVNEATELGAVDKRLSALSAAPWNLERLQQVAMDRAKATFTLNALIDSLKTVNAQRAADAGDMSAQGLTSELPFARVSHVDGQYMLFQQKDGQIARARLREAQALAGRPAAEFEEMKSLRSLIEYCLARGIRLQLFIPPYHAHYLEIVDAVGLWERFEAWKVALATLVDEYQKEAGESRVELWDFATYDEYATESVPPKGERSVTMNWFWEPLHFKKALGDLMLARMLNSSTTNFGVRLTAQSVQQRLARTRELRSLYRQRSPYELRELAATIRAQRDAGNDARPDEFEHPARLRRATALVERSTVQE